jgi:uncharacterized cupin superfamily protein
VVRVYNVLSAELEPEEECRPGFHRASTRVGEAIGGERIGASLYELEDGDRVAPYHYHHGVEEWLYVVSGTPTLREPGGERTLRAGDWGTHDADRLNFRRGDAVDYWDGE